MNTPVLSLQDHFLMAMPSISDGYFKQSLVYICSHRQEGTMGLIINQPLDGVVLGDILAQLKILSEVQAINDQQVFFGGAVTSELGFIIHQSSDSWQSTLVSSDEISITTSQDVLESIVAGHGPHKNLIVLGCARWGAGQLEKEMSQNLWLSVKAIPDIIFEVSPQERRQAAFDLLGINVNQLSSEYGHA